MKKSLSVGKVNHCEQPDSLTPAFWKNDTYFVLDQIKLPQTVDYIVCSTEKDVAKVIVDMNLRGAPLIGAAVSAAVALLFRNDFVTESQFMDCCAMLLETRPTAVNLRNVLDETRELYQNLKEKNADSYFKHFKEYSLRVHKRDIERNLKMGEIGADYLTKLIPKKTLKILTHCNAGSLATCGYGTALGVIRSLNKRGLVDLVWVDETRPYLQGARLTAFEMLKENIPHTIITDSTAAWLMKTGKVDVVITGADRVALNGDLANKIGTYSLAVNANYHNIPYVSVMPLETFDFSIETGEEIVIEERSESELLFFNNKRIALDGSKALHLGFDVVPAVLTKALITEKGVVTEISKKKIKRLFYE